MKFQNLLSKKKNSINLSHAELAKRVVKVKVMDVQTDSVPCLVYCSNVTYYLSPLKCCSYILFILLVMSEVFRLLQEF